jgi:hypothetical protein
MYIKIMNPDKATVSSVGCYLYDANGNLLKSYSETCGLSTSYVNYNCNINNDMKYTLTAGTTYKFVLYAVVGGKEYKDTTRTFTTTASSSSQTTPAPTSAADSSQTADGNALATVAEKEYATYQGQDYAYQYGTSPWCCNFVSWCARQAGISTSVMISTATVQTMYDSLIYNCEATVVTTPQRGDLVFYRYTDYDSAKFHHIGIMTSSTETVQGNVSNTWFKGSPDALDNVLEMVYVRPKYDNVYVAPTTAYFSDYNLNKTETNNAEVYIKIQNPNQDTVTQVGCELYDKSGNLLKDYTESCSYTTSYVNYTCNFVSDMGYTLSPGTTYQIVLYAVVGGTKISDTKRSFQTEGTTETVNKGDINGDGVINGKDVNLLAQSCVAKVTLTDAQKEVADLDGDGKITGKDVNKLAQVCVGKATLN